MILNSPTWMLHRNDYAFDCGVKCFFGKTPQVKASYLQNYTSDIDGVPYLGNKILKGILGVSHNVIGRCHQKLNTGNDYLFSFVLECCANRTMVSCFSCWYMGS